VFNLDKVGISDWEDRKTRKVVVPATMEGHTIHHGVSRNVKHISVIACVSAFGESLPPYILTSQNSSPVQEQLRKPGVRLGRDLILKSHSRPYVNAEIFLDYISSVFLPYVIRLRSLAGLVAEDAVLLMDNCSSHASDHVISLLTAARVCIITFAPHAAQIFQILDLILFGVLKRRTGYAGPFGRDKATAKFIMRVYHDFGQTMIQSNIRGAFEALGFKYDTRTDPYRLLINEKKLRESAGFRELWSLDFPLDGLSSRRRAARFGWINKAG
jgi:hypothetical protein